jgi:hypothetical protein
MSVINALAAICSEAPGTLIERGMLPRLAVL